MWHLHVDENQDDIQKHQISESNGKYVVDGYIEFDTMTEALRYIQNN